MKTVENSALDKAKIRDSKNKDLSPIINVDKDTLRTLAQIHEDYPYDKSKFCQVILSDSEGIILGILSFRLSYVDAKTKVKYTKCKGGEE